MEILHNRPSLSQEDNKAVEDVIRSGYIVQNSYVKRLEEIISQELDFTSAIAVTNGTSAIYLSLYALKVGYGDEVIIPSYVCSALLNAIYLIKATPVIVDVCDSDFNISWSDVDRHITQKTKAIIVPHIHGMPSYIPEFLKKNISVVEDCATALCSKVDERSVGHKGCMAILSFYASKYITTGQGGMVLSNNQNYIDNLRDYRNFDCCEQYIPRFNFQMTDIHAAIGCSQMNKIAFFRKRRAEIAKVYKEFFDSKGIAYQLPYSQNVKYNNYRFVIKIDEKNRNRLMEYLHKNSIGCIIPIDNYELLHNYMHLDKNDYQVSENISRTTLSLPIYPALDDLALEYIMETLKKY